MDQPYSGNAFPDLIPDPSTGVVTYDVDNDGDKVNDSVWLDLGFPVQHDPNGKAYKPLFAFMVLGLNGRIPLNTAGNIQGRVRYDDLSTPAVIEAGQPLQQHTSHLGYSPSEINPSYALGSTAGYASGAADLQTLLTGTVGPPLVPGRYGEPEAFGISPPQVPRAGRSYSSTGLPLEAFDADYDTQDFFPTYNTSEDQDLLDINSVPLLPSERIRKFTTPLDTSGNGLVVPFDTQPTPANAFGNGYDKRGRVGFFMYFRPPGVYAQDIPGYPGNTSIPTILTNPYHGYESHRNPGGIDDINRDGTPDAAPFVRDYMAKMPYDPGLSNVNVPTSGMGAAGLTYPNGIDTAHAIPPYAAPWVYSDGTYAGGSLNYGEADQLNLYEPTPYDAPFTNTDLEWLYRQNDVDGSGLNSRLSQLTVNGFSGAGGPYQSQMFSVDSFDTTNFSSTYNAGSLNTLGARPHLLHGDRRINLNYPFPHSPNPNEPIRQKWCQEVYQTLKLVLLPQPGYTYTAEELAAIGQYTVNIVDFRDPDATMTAFKNPDLEIKPANTTATPPIPAGVQLRASGSPLVQYGMEYLPVAINEVLAYQFTRKAGGGQKETQRLFVELINTLTQDGGPGTASDLDLAGWGFVLTEDDLSNPSGNIVAAERPNTATGQLDVGTVTTHFIPIEGTTGATPGLSPKVKAFKPNGDFPDYTATNHNLLVLANQLADPTSEGKDFTTPGHAGHLKHNGYHRAERHG